jgi:PAS domain S-box-containing protein
MSVFADLEIYRTVVEHMQTGIYMVDCEQKIQFWNDGAENITGHLRQHVLGHFCRDFFPAARGSGQKRGLRAGWRAGERVEGRKAGDSGSDAAAQGRASGDGAGASGADTEPNR